MKETIHLRLSREDRAALEAMARESGIPVSTILRLRVRLLVESYQMYGLRAIMDPDPGAKTDDDGGGST